MRRQSIFSFLKKADIYAYKPEMLYNGEDAYQSRYGGLVTLFVCLMILSSAALTVWRYFQKTAPFTNVSTEFVANPEGFIINPDTLAIAFGIQTSAAEHYIDPMIYSVEISYKKQFKVVTNGTVNTTVERTNLQLITCDKVDYLDPSLFKNLQLTKMYCIQNFTAINGSMVLTGDWDSDLYGRIDLNVRRCTNTSTRVCKSVDEIDKIFNGGYLAVNYIRKVPNPSDYYNPVSFTPAVFFTPLSSIYTRYVYMYMEDNIIRTDGSLIGYLPPDELKYNSVAEFKTDITKFADKGKDYPTFLVSMVIRMNQVKNIMDRRYKNIYDYLAEFGGLVQVITVVGILLTWKLSKMLMFLDLAHTYLRREEVYLSVVKASPVSATPDEEFKGKKIHIPLVNMSSTAHPEAEIEDKNTFIQTKDQPFKTAGITPHPIKGKTDAKNFAHHSSVTTNQLEIIDVEKIALTAEGKPQQKQPRPFQSEIVMNMSIDPKTAQNSKNQSILKPAIKNQSKAVADEGGKQTVRDSTIKTCDLKSKSVQAKWNGDYSKTARPAMQTTGYNNGRGETSDINLITGNNTYSKFDIHTNIQLDLESRTDPPKFRNNETQEVEKFKESTKSPKILAKKQKSINNDKNTNIQKEVLFMDQEINLHPAIISNTSPKLITNDHTFRSFKSLADQSYNTNKVELGRNEQAKKQLEKINALDIFSKAFFPCCKKKSRITSILNTVEIELYGKCDLLTLIGLVEDMDKLKRLVFTPQQKLLFDIIPSGKLKYDPFEKSFVVSKDAYNENVWQDSTNPELHNKDGGQAVPESLALDVLKDGTPKARAHQAAIATALESLSKKKNKSVLDKNLIHSLGFLFHESRQAPNNSTNNLPPISYD
jgi:hypothetical protein